MTRQLPEVPDQAADEQRRRPVAQPQIRAGRVSCDGDHFLAPAWAMHRFLEPNLKIAVHHFLI